MRHALYFAPHPKSALAGFGEWWLGRTAQADFTNLPDIGLDPARHQDMVADARLYGFHATLKPPFFLAEGTDLRDLEWTVRDFVRQRRPFSEPPLRLETLDGFLALRPQAPSAAIDRLADDCVRAFDRFRAPASVAERAKRMTAPLSRRQRELLDLWGYPYVLDQFRFHMTLTCRLDDTVRETVAGIILSHASDALAEPVSFDALCLFRQAVPGSPFSLVERYRFGD